jgi:hypothetical protein
MSRKATVLKTFSIVGKDKQKIVPNSRNYRFSHQTPLIKIKTINVNEK